MPKDKLLRINCELCGGSNNQQVIWRNPQKVVCRNCGLVFKNPYPSKRSLSQYYGKSAFASGSSFRSFEKGSRLYALSRERIRFLERYLPLTGGRVLDIGCSAGELLSLFDTTAWEK